MNEYQKELQELREHDEIQGMHELKHGYNFIDTAGHGFLVIPKNDKRIKIANKIGGYKGELATYLEEDNELTDFFEIIEEELFCEKLEMTQI